MTDPGGWGPPAPEGRPEPGRAERTGAEPGRADQAGVEPGLGQGRPEQAGAAPDAPAAALAAGLTDGEWHRLHPATPLLKGGIALVVIIGIVLNNARELLVESFLPGARRDRDPDGDLVAALVDSGWLWAVVGGVAAVLLVMVALFWVSWRLHTFRVTAEVVEVRSGVLFRRERRAPLDRIQGINVQRPFLARLFGAAKLQVSQAGDDANVDLAYLRSAAADDLRREVLRRAGGAQQAAQDRASGRRPARPGLGGLFEQRAAEFTAPELDPDEAPPESVVSLPLGRLVGSVVLSGTTLFIVAAVVAVGVSVAVTGQWVLAVALLPAVLGSSGFYLSRVSKSLRFSLASTRDGIRIGYGLLSTTNETLPPGRIHSVKVSQPLLWRPFGWWEITINRASRSSAKGADGQANTSILPVGDEADVRRVLELVLPELVGVAAADARLVEAAEGGAPADGTPADGAAPAGAAARAEPATPADAAAPPEPATPVLGGHWLPGLVDGAGAPAPDVDPTVLAAVADERDRLADEQAERTLSLVHDALGSSGAEGGFTTSPRRAAVLRWFSWRRNGFRTAPGAVLLRTGAVWRTLVVVPLPRVQSVAFDQGPLLRRLRLARVRVHTVQGPITADIGAIDEDDAHGFFEDVSRLAVEAARADRTHRWLERASSRGEGR